MTAARVHAVMAAALADSERLERWLEDPERVRALGVDPAELDWQGLRGFAGLAAKIRHNPLRAELPLTFRVLKSTGLELELFCDYAPTAARLRAQDKNRNRDKIESLRRFLKTWIDPANEAHALLWDVFRHETAIMSLRPLVGGARAGTASPAPERAGADPVPRVRGTLILHALGCDPDEIEALVSGGTLDLAALPRHECLLGYWVDDAGAALRLLRLDPLAFHLLESIDGATPIGALVERMRAAGIEVDRDTLLGLFGALAEQGLIRLEGAR